MLPLERRDRSFPEPSRKLLFYKRKVRYCEATIICAEVCSALHQVLQIQALLRSPSAQKSSCQDFHQFMTHQASTVSGSHRFQLLAHTKCRRSLSPWPLTCFIALPWVPIGRLGVQGKSELACSQQRGSKLVGSGGEPALPHGLQQTQPVDVRCQGLFGKH